MTRRLAALFVALALAAAPVLGAFNTIVLQPSNAVTAAGAGSWQAVPSASMLAVQVDITTAGGTPTFDLWLQGTNDSGDTDGYDVPADLVLVHAGSAAAQGTLTANTRDIVAAKTTTTAEKFVGVYKQFPWKYCRVRWTISGAGATVTFSASAGTK